MIDIGVISYALGAVACVILSLVLLLGWARHSKGTLLIFATTLTATWLIAASYHSYSLFPSLAMVNALEVARSFGWFIFIFSILGMYTEKKSDQSRLLIISCYLLLAVSLIVTILSPDIFSSLVTVVSQSGAIIVMHLMVSVTGLFLVEQLYRNSDESQRWALKYMCLGLASMFAYDVYLYSEAMLFKGIDSDAWNLRGMVYVLVAPLIAVSAARNPVWKLDVFVSREMVFHTATLMVTGLYLLIVAAAGYYIKLYGGSWGGAAQYVFLFTAFVFLLVLLLSGQFRARLKVILNKHFYNYKYDYRNEWLRFNRTLSESREDVQGLNYKRRTIKAIAQIVESPGGYLFARRDGNNFFMSECLNEPESNIVLDYDSSLIESLNEKKWVIEVGGRLDGTELQNAWLAIPLFHEDILYGVIVLSSPRAPIKLIWEDFDLLKTAANQAVNYLVQLDNAQALSEARQFEAFHRLSAYVVHDLKNISAQLSLIVENAAKHREKPEFIDDAFDTIENSVNKMDRMLSQLKQQLPAQQENTYINIMNAIEKVKSVCIQKKPVPMIESSISPQSQVLVDEDKFIDVITHLVQNSQDATGDKGKVIIRLSGDDRMAIIEVVDTGEGMNKDFIEKRLFKPFDTTKGNAGMGIGVYEARDYIQSVNGSIDVKSKPGDGTTFTIKLPLVYDNTTVVTYTEAIS